MPLDAIRRPAGYADLEAGDRAKMPIVPHASLWATGARDQLTLAREIMPYKRVDPGSSKKGAHRRECGQWDLQMV